MFFRIIILTFICTSSIIVVSAQELKIKADSLFEKQKFTEAFELYDSLYVSGKTSEAMLLKMAYIKEGLGDYTQSLIFLNKYYELTNKRKAFDKMAELAEENNLQGYEYSDNRLFSSWLNNYNNEIVILAILLLSITVGVVIVKKRKGRLSIGAFSAQLGLTLLLILVINNILINEEAIILKDQTIVMSGPSAGAEPLLVLEKGHKIEILEQQDIWVKIKWEDQEAWVRNQQLVLL